MKITANLALYPAAARRRSAWLRGLALLLAVGLSATHFAWAYSGGAPAAQIRGEAELRAREAAVLGERLAGLQQQLDPAVVTELAERVGIANELIARRAVDPVALLALLESTAPEGLVLQRLSLSSSPEGVRAELTLRAADQAEALQLIADLQASGSVHDVVPVSEQLAAGGDEIVLSLLYRPQRFEDR